MCHLVTHVAAADSLVDSLAGISALLDHPPLEARKVEVEHVVGERVNRGGADMCTDSLDGHPGWMAGHRLTAFGKFGLNFFPYLLVRPCVTGSLPGTCDSANLPEQGAVGYLFVGYRRAADVRPVRVTTHISRAVGLGVSAENHVS